MDVGVDGGTAWDAARGHVGVILWVNVLQALPWHTWAELWGRKIHSLQPNFTDTGDTD